MNNLPENVCKECLFLSRRTLHAYIRNQKMLPPYIPEHEELREYRGAFVTLKRSGQLRGCIGYVEGIKPLWQTIEDCTIAAASQDPRFPPVRPDELPEIEIEISVLSPMKQISSIDEIEVGQHGLIITKGPFRGLLLPQVATEYGWDKIRFLQHTCIKAGLPPDAWKEGAQIEVFTADVFSESEYDLTPQ